MPKKSKFCNISLLRSTRGLPVLRTVDGATYFYCPHSVASKGYVFTGVSLHRSHGHRRVACQGECTSPPGQNHHPLDRTTHHRQDHHSWIEPPPGSDLLQEGKVIDLPPPPQHMGTTGRWYASYWNDSNSNSISFATFKNISLTTLITFIRMGQTQFHLPHFKKYLGTSPPGGKSH